MAAPLSLQLYPYFTDETQPDHAHRRQQAAMLEQAGFLRKAQLEIALFRRLRTKGLRFKGKVTSKEISLPLLETGLTDFLMNRPARALPQLQEIIAECLAEMKAHPAAFPLVPYNPATKSHLVRPTRGPVRSADKRLTGAGKPAPR